MKKYLFIGGPVNGSKLDGNGVNIVYFKHRTTLEESYYYLKEVLLPDGTSEFVYVHQDIKDDIVYRLYIQHTKDRRS